MSPYEVLIAKDVYDGNDNEKTPKILFGPKLVFAYSAEDATKKAVIESNMSSNDVDNTNFYTKEFSLKG